MTDRVVVVPTYPAHFYQTELTLRSVIQHMDTVEKIIVIADNISNLAWSDYLQDCADVYKPYHVQIIPVSTISVANQFRQVPWVRQQIVKLHLDQIIEPAEWLLIDGDTQLNTAPPTIGRFCSRTPYQGISLDIRDPQPGEKTSQMIFYVRQVMKDQYSGFQDHEGKYITASHPPIHRMSAEVLESLRSHVSKQHSRSFADLHLDIALDDRYSVTEWDLIEWYSRQYLDLSDHWLFDQSWFCSTWSCDRELGQTWFVEQALEIDPAIWARLPLAKYL
jgi:hypothetical protein